MIWTNNYVICFYFFIVSALYIKKAFMNKLTSNGYDLKEGI